MHRPFLFRGFKSSYEILENSLGTLEREVMTVVWNEAEISVREACGRLGSAVAYGKLVDNKEDIEPDKAEIAPGRARSST